MKKQRGASAKSAGKGVIQGASTARAAVPSATGQRRGNAGRPSKPSAGSQNRTPAWAVCIGLAALTLCVFGRTVRYDFVNFDDETYVYQNSVIMRGVTPKGVALAFTHGSLGTWDPLTTISHMVDCQLYGLRAGGHHLTNVLLHTASVVLLFLLLRQMTGACWRSAFVAAVFAIHPLRVESVAWISERKDVLSGVFFMLTLGTYVRYTRRGGWPAYALVLMCFTLGLLSKAMLVTVPFLLLVLDWWPLGRFAAAGSGPREDRIRVTTRLCLEKLPLLVLAIASLAAAAIAQAHGNAIQSLEKYPMQSRLGNALVSIGAYLWQMIYPARLAALYPYPRNGLPAAEVSLAALALAAFTTGALLWRGRRPYLLAGWLWYVGMLVPVLGLVQLGVQARADRYTYLPQIGVYVALTWLAASVLSRWRHGRVMLGCAAASIIAALSTACVAQAAYWRDSGALWQHTVDCTADNSTAQYNLANYMLRVGRLDDARPHLEAALKISPNDSDSHSDLGYVFLEKGRVDDALSQFQQAVNLDSNYAQAQNNLAFVLNMKRRPEEAIVHLHRALTLKPAYAEAHSNLGDALLLLGQGEEAGREYQRALEIQPGMELAQKGLLRAAWLLATSPDERLRSGARALEFAEQAGRIIGEDDPATLGTLAAADAEAGRFDEAISNARRGLAESATRPDSLLTGQLRKELAAFAEGRAFRDAVSGQPDPGP